VSDNTYYSQHFLYRSLQIALARLAVPSGRVDVAVTGQRRHLVDFMTIALIFLFMGYHATITSKQRM
jgi:hypothetical protein